jgi:type IV pilus assembly protein PilW
MSQHLQRRVTSAPGQAGVTLVELMVALTIGLFIALALGAIFVNAKSAFQAQDKLASLHDSERLGISVLTAGVQLAGYFPDPEVRLVADALPVQGTPQSTVQFAAGQGVAGISGSGGASDTLAVRFVSASGDGLLNCQGSVNTSGSNQLVTNVFSISAANELQCAVNDNAPVPLVTNVSAMTVLYGTDSAASGNIDKYLSASAVSAASLWGRVRSVQVRLTFASQFDASRVGPGASTAVTWVQNIGVMGAL